jgi:glycogen debranching enzyme
MAASFADLPSAETTYRKLSNSYSQLLSASRDYYQTYLNSHVSLDLPDPVLQQAYQWAQVSVLQGLVKNPFLGTGLVAGYRGSGDDQRPGYAWFFGRDALWTALALDAEGDFATTRAALQFLGKYQRADGKVTHEIAQGASFVPWFQSMPYAYASADATPLFIIATDDYVRRSGDTQFAREAWDKLWLAYKFIVSTYDSSGLPRNDGIGHGWVEGGPLLPVRTEIYQSGVVTQALKSLASLASIVGKQDVSSATTAEFESKQVLLNRAFWMTEQKRYAFGLDLAGRQVDTPSVLAAVPMWFGLLDNEKAASMITRLNQPDIQSDWGMRIIPSTSPKYEAAGYHSGTVWPLFTGWASVADYKYHDAFSGFSNLRTNALLTFDGSLGHVTEVLSGNYYQTLATGSPQQVWSSAMVISPILTGLFGLQVDSLAHHVEFDPHVPANWTRFAIKHVQAGECTLDFSYRKVVNMLTLEIQHTGGVCNLDFSPALSPRTHVLSAELNGHPVVFQMRANETDQHVSIPLNVKAPVESLVIHLKDDFGLSQEFALPSLGSESDGMRIVSENWSEGEDLLTLNASSTSGGTYDLDVWNAAEISSVDGAELVRTEPNQAKLRIHLSKTMPTQDAKQEVLFHLRHNQAMHHERFVQPDGRGESHDH